MLIADPARARRFVLWMFGGCAGANRVLREVILPLLGRRIGTRCADQLIPVLLDGCCLTHPDTSVTGDVLTAMSRVDRHAWQRAPTTDPLQRLMRSPTYQSHRELVECLLALD
jgi:hypothetical protein